MQPNQKMHHREREFSISYEQARKNLLFHEWSFISSLENENPIVSSNFHRLHLELIQSI